MPEIDKHLVLSTGHVHKDDAEYLNNEATFPTNDHSDMAFTKTEYGWTLFVNYSEETIAEYDGRLYPWDISISSDIIREWKTDFNAISDMAREYGCKYVTFDRDGPIEEGLAQYEW